MQNRERLNSSRESGNLKENDFEKIKRMPTHIEGVNRKSTMVTASSNGTKIERMTTEEESKFGETSFSQN